MRTILYFFIVLLCFTSCKNKSVTSKQQNTFQSIFNGKDLITKTKTKSDLISIVKPNDWNQVHLIVKNNKMQHYINGILFSEVNDLDGMNRVLKGFIGVQVHVGPPMKIEYKNIKLKYL